MHIESQEVPGKQTPGPAVGPRAEERGLALLLGALIGARGSGTGEEAAQRLIERLGFEGAARADAALLRSEAGLSALAARRLEAAFALGRRLERRSLGARPTLRSPDRVARLLAPELRGEERECFFALLLDSKHRLKRRVLVSIGTLSASLVHPREVFREAIRSAAAALVVAHNHPSGDPEPSAEDIEVTRRLHEAGKLLGIPLLDHVVVGDGRFVSLRERLRL